MTGSQFEKRLESLFRRLGYTVRHTGSLDDFGADLVVEKEGARTVVQAKRWSNQVGMRAVREALAAKAMYDCSEAMVVTSSTFTWRAQALAERNSVVLWDRERLISLLGSTNGAPTINGSAGAVVDDRRCARCGEPVSDRVRAFCLSHQESFGGLVYCYQHQKEFKRRRA